MPVYRSLFPQLLLVPIYTPGSREAITVKLLTKGHDHHNRGQDSKPQSDDSELESDALNRTTMAHHNVY